MHLLNKSATIKRRLEKDWTLSDSLKMRESQTELSESIELGTSLLIEKCNLTSRNDCFKLLRNLKETSAFPPVMNYDGVSFSTDDKKANAFNDFFSSVYGCKIHKNVPTALDSSIELQDVTFGVLEIQKILSKCVDSSSMGSDQVPSFLLRDGCQVLAPAVMELFQNIQKSSHWPKEWKTSYITPLHKNGSTSDVINYRPISLLPKLSIVFKKMFNFLYLIVRPLVTNAQHGFMKKRSTTTQLISYFDVLYNNPDENFPCASVYFDIKKAFDSAPHHKLLTKLAAFGFDDAFLHLFSDYLEDRHQIVRRGSCFSRPSVVTSGVPQGSVLEPLLFILYMNDLVDHLQNSQVYLYADDLKLLCVDCFEGLQIDINGIYEWSRKSQLEFHPKKCKAMNFKRSQSPLFLGEAEILFTREIMGLGMLVTEDFCWTTHVKMKFAKCNKIFNFLKRNIPFQVSILRKKPLYQTMILAVLLYCSQAWCVTAGILKVLENFQRKVLRWVIRSEDYNETLSKLNLYPICYQIARADLILLWKTWHETMESDLKLHVNSTTLSSRGSVKTFFEQPLNKKIQTDNCFLSRTIHSANYLISINLIDFRSSFKIFCKNLDNFLIAKTHSFNYYRPCT